MTWLLRTLGLVLALLIFWLLRGLRATTLTNLTETVTLTGTGSYAGAAGLGQAGGAINMGSGTWSAMQNAFTFGTGNNQVNQVYTAQRTVANGADDNLDFGAGSLKNPVGDTATFTKIKAIFINIESPDGTKSLRVGPNAVANAFPGPWGAVSANVYKTIYNSEIVCLEPITGFAVNATTGVVPIHNASGVSVTYDILVLGLA